MPCSSRSTNCWLSNHLIEIGIKVVTLVRIWSGTLYPRLDLISPQVTSHPSPEAGRTVRARAVTTTQPLPSDGRFAAPVSPRGASRRISRHVWRILWRWSATRCSQTRWRHYFRGFLTFFSITFLLHFPLFHLLQERQCRVLEEQFQLINDSEVNSI